MAPRGKFVNKDSGVEESLLFTTDQITFHDDGSVTVVFFGIKNDTSREGFEVKLPPAGEPQVDHVAALKCYIQRTRKFRPDKKPVFLSLTQPYTAIQHATISKQLNEAIDLAGLGDRGYSARSFRPTGATAAVKSGCLPETAMQIGRWKTREVFFNRYVYPNAPSSYSDNVMAFPGV